MTPVLSALATSTLISATCKCQHAMQLPVPYGFHLLHGRHCFCHPSVGDSCSNLATTLGVGEPLASEVGTEIDSVGQCRC